MVKCCTCGKDLGENKYSKTPEGVEVANWAEIALGYDVAYYCFDCYRRLDRETSGRNDTEINSSGFDYWEWV